MSAPPPGRLAGRVALVTGAGSGIGRAAANRLAADGAAVGCLDIDPDNAGRTAALIRESGGDAVVLPADVSKERHIKEAVGRLTGNAGRLDIVVANAAIELDNEESRVDLLSLDTWERTVAVNLTGVFLTCKHGARAVLGSGGGSIVCVGSPTGLYGCSPGYSAYSASKAGVHGLVRVMAADYAAHRVRVNGVIPGYTRTPMTRFVSPEEEAELLRTIPLGRAAEPEDIAPVIAFLASDEARYVNGALWAVDGGMTAI